MLVGCASLGAAIGYLRFHRGPGDGSARSAAVVSDGRLAESRRATSPNGKRAARPDAAAKLRSHRCRLRYRESSTTWPTSVARRSIAAVTDNLSSTRPSHSREGRRLHLTRVRRRRNRRVVFGFPGSRCDQAAKGDATRARLARSFEKLSDEQPDSFSKFGVHIGISSGSMIFAPLQQERAPRLCCITRRAGRICAPFLHRESLLRLARFARAAHLRAREQEHRRAADRFSERRRCARTARNLRAAHARAPKRRRRKSRGAIRFWNGVVLFPRKTLGRSLRAIPKARAAQQDEDDAPLQLYLRRLEPLAFHLRSNRRPSRSVAPL